MSRFKRKRPRASTEPYSTKRQKVKQSEGAQGGEDFYAVKDIIDENETHYRIDWENNAATGESYSPTWEPKSFANDEAVADWGKKKIRTPSGRSVWSVCSSDSPSPQHKHINRGARQSTETWNRRGNFTVSSSGTVASSRGDYPIGWAMFLSVHDNASARVYRLR